MNKILKEAIRKCSHLNGRVWYGSLRPQEILALRDIGVKENPKQWSSEIAVERKRKGICNPLWFYFEANEEFHEKRANYKGDRY